MKIKSVGSLSFLVLIFCCLETLFASGGIEDEFQYGHDSKSMGLGNSFCGVSGGITSLYENYAGITSITRSIAQFSYSKFSHDTFFGTAGFGMPTLDFGVLGAAVSFFGDRGLTGYSSTYEDTGDFNWFRIKFLGGYAISFKKTPIPLSVGLGGGMDFFSIAGNRSVMFNADAGFLWRYWKKEKFPKNYLQNGLSFKNIFVFSGHKFVSQIDTLPLEICLGTHYVRDLSKIISVGVFNDLSLLFYNIQLTSEGFGDEYTLAIDTSAGLELNFLRALSLRGGYRMRNGLTAGIGFIVKRFSFDYALVFSHNGYNHNGTMRYAFGKDLESLRIKKEEELEKILNLQVEEAMKEERLKQEEEVNRLKLITATELSNMQFKANQDLLKIQAENRLKITQLAQSNLNQYNLLQNRFQIAQTESSNRVAQLNKAIETSRIEQERILKQLSNSFTLAENQIKEEFNKKEKLYIDALAAFSAGNLESAKALFTEIQKIDPKNTEVPRYLKMIENSKKSVSQYSKESLDLYKEGMKFFLAKDYEKAIKMWEKLLAEDPSNTMAIKAIEKAKRRVNTTK